MPSSDTGYDSLPYPSLPIAYTQPAQMAAMAVMFGRAPPSVWSARVLEIGCAGGGNIVPLAMRYPQGSFTGIDLSRRHVEEANGRVAALGLRNIKIKQADLRDIRFGPDAFDYIICHGVFSWVPRGAQAAIFRICTESLSAFGIAAISYNVLPGWHVRSVARDIAQFFGTGGDMRARVANTRAALEEIARGVDGNQPYGAALKVEAARFAKMPASHVFGEFLGETNEPIHFTAFAERAEAAGLAYLCDAEVSSALPEFMAPQASAGMVSMAGGDALTLQQKLDFFTGRPFRRSLLVRRKNANAGAQTIEPSRLARLHFHAPITEANNAFKDSRGRVVPAREALAVRMLSHLARIYPSTASVDELLGETPGNHAVLERALTILLGLAGRRQATAFTEPLLVGREDAKHPAVWALARAEAKTAQPWVTGQHHRPVPKSALLRFVLPLMDGSLDRDELMARLRARLAEDEELRAIATPEQVLRYLSRNGLLTT